MSPAIYTLTQRVMRTSIYNMVHNTWRTIRLVGQDSLLETNFRFGSTLVSIFDKHVTMREQIELVKKIKPRADGPIPLAKLLIFGGITLDDYFVQEANGGAESGSAINSTSKDSMPCIVLSFTNSNQSPVEHELTLEERKEAALKKLRKSRRTAK